MKGLKMLNKIKKLLQSNKQDQTELLRKQIELIEQAQLLQKARIIVADRKSKQLGRKITSAEISPLEAYNWLDAWLIGQKNGVEI
tara:strand:- start:19 stop:273 length:255 start_codon:yes stop_codon:yes gene_type:complete